MMYIFAENDADAEEFYDFVTKGTFPIYGYPELQEKLADGYKPITTAEQASDVEASTYDVLYTPNFPNNPEAGQILDEATIHTTEAGIPNE